jgi:hypothetical protein
MTNAAIFSEISLFVDILGVLKGLPHFLQMTSPALFSVPHAKHNWRRVFPRDSSSLLPKENNLS